MPDTTLDRDAAPTPRGRPATRALLWCLALLAVAEVAVRRIEAGIRPPGTLDVEAPLVVVLGTSRSRHGLDPAAIEAALAARGVAPVFAGNASRVAATTAGLLQVWRDEIRSAVAGHAGVLAIEVRVEGLNDNYLAEGEKLPADLVAADGSPAAAPSPLAALADGELEDASWWLLSRLRLTELPTVLRRLEAAGGGEAGGATGAVGAPRSAADAGTAVDADSDAASDGLTGKARRRAEARAQRRPAWATGSRGFEPRKTTDRTLDEDDLADHYRTKVLADFQSGGAQTRALRALIAESRATGLTPLLYLMPVTPKHKEAYPDGLWDRMVGELHALAAAERVDFIDLDAGHGLPDTAFHDTSHLLPPGAAEVSRRFAEQAVLPALR